MKNDIKTNHTFKLERDTTPASEAVSPKIIIKLYKFKFYLIN